MTSVVSTTDTRVAGLIEQIRAVAPLADADIARATGTTDEMAAAWRQGRVEPRDWQVQRLGELLAVVEKAAEVVKPETIPDWLGKDVPRLSGRVPLDVIAGGEHREVLGMIGELIYPTFT
jgi:DNA-binding transcriptional regulator YiaG